MAIDYSKISGPMSSTSTTKMSKDGGLMSVNPPKPPTTPLVASVAAQKTTPAIKAQPVAPKPAAPVAQPVAPAVQNPEGKTASNPTVDPALIGTQLMLQRMNGNNSGVVDPNLTAGAMQGNIGTALELMKAKTNALQPTTPGGTTGASSTPGVTAATIAQTMSGNTQSQGSALDPNSLSREQANKIFGTDFTGVNTNPDGTFSVQGGGDAMKKFTQAQNGLPGSWNPYVMEAYTDSAGVYHPASVNEPGALSRGDYASDGEYMNAVAQRDAYLNTDPNYHAALMKAAGINASSDYLNAVKAADSQKAAAIAEIDRQATNDRNQLLQSLAARGVTPETDSSARDAMQKIDSLYGDKRTAVISEFEGKRAAAEGGISASVQKARADVLDRATKAIENYLKLQQAASTTTNKSTELAIKSKKQQADELYQQGLIDVKQHDLLIKEADTESKDELRDTQGDLNVAKTTTEDTMRADRQTKLKADIDYVRAQTTEATARANSIIKKASASQGGGQSMSDDEQADALAALAATGVNPLQVTDKQLAQTVMNMRRASDGGSLTDLYMGGVTSKAKAGAAGRADGEDLDAILEKAFGAK